MICYYRIDTSDSLCRTLNIISSIKQNQLGFKWQVEQIDRPANVTLSFPPGAPLGISIRLNSYSQCLINEIEQQSTPSSFVVGDIILSLNGIDLSKAKGGIKSIQTLLDLSLKSSRHFVIQRSANNNNNINRGSFVAGNRRNLHPDAMTHEQKIEAAKERVVNAKSGVGQCAGRLASARREMKDASAYLDSLLELSKNSGDGEDYDNHRDDNGANNRQGHNKLGNGNFNQDENDYNDSQDEMQEILEGKADADYFGLNDVAHDQNTSVNTATAALNGDTGRDNNGNNDNIDSQRSTEMEVEGQAATNSDSATPADSAYCLPVSGSGSGGGKSLKKKSNFPQCSVIGCTNLSRSGKGGVCIRHGAKKRLCIHPGCTNLQNTKRVCRRHGAPAKACSVEGCTTNARKHGLCRKHGGMDTSQCRHPNCTLQSKGEGLCAKHGGKEYVRICKVEGCSNNVQGVYADRLCRRHGAVIARCKVEDCDKPMKAKGYCHRHWAEWKESEGLA